LEALDIGPGDEVITTPFTFIATSEAVRAVGARPVFVDIDPHTFNIDPARIEAAITPRTRALLPVHLFGQPCDMRPILELARRHDLHVIEDCAQALGASYGGRRVGSLGIAGCLSFFPSKNLGCLGDGGMIVTDDESLYRRAEVLRRHGGRVKYHHEVQGTNSRLDELQAAVLRVKLPHIERWNRLRREHACRYNGGLSAMPGVTAPRELTSSGYAPLSRPADESNPLLAAVYHQYTLLAEDRESTMQAMAADGIASAIYYPLPLHLQPVNSDLGYACGSLPVAERVAGQCLSLPMFPELTESEIDRVLAGLRRAPQAAPAAANAARAA
jgi:dTDP-4-amino-4,6-dideoxygalactose transaminase